MPDFERWLQVIADGHAERGLVLTDGEKQLLSSDLSSEELLPQDSDDLKKATQSLRDSMHVEFWRLVRQGGSFCSDEALLSELGQPPEVLFAGCSASYINVARVHFSFQAAIQPLLRDQPHLVLTQILAQLNTHVRHHFFPTRGPLPLPKAGWRQSVTQYSQYMEKVYPGLEIARYADESPLNRGSGCGCLTLFLLGFLIPSGIGFI